MDGDWNTTFHHTSSLNRRKKNRISGLTNSAGNWISDEREVAEDVPNWPIQISEEDSGFLVTLFPSRILKSIIGLSNRIRPLALMACMWNSSKEFTSCLM